MYVPCLVSTPAPEPLRGQPARLYFTFNTPPPLGFVERVIVRALQLAKDSGQPVFQLYAGCCHLLLSGGLVCLRRRAGLEVEVQCNYQSNLVEIVQVTFDIITREARDAKWACDCTCLGPGGRHVFLLEKRPQQYDELRCNACRLAAYSGSAPASMLPIEPPLYITYCSVDWLPKLTYKEFVSQNALLERDIAKEITAANNGIADVGAQLQAMLPAISATDIKIWASQNTADVMLQKFGNLGGTIEQLLNALSKAGLTVLSDRVRGYAPCL